MDSVLKPQSSASVWGYVGFKPNKRGEPTNVKKPVAEKSGNLTNPKPNHSTQLLNLEPTNTMEMNKDLPDSYLLRCLFPTA